MLNGATRTSSSLGQTIRLVVQYRDNNGKFVDIDSEPQIQITDADSNVVLSLTNTGVVRQSTGVYYYDYLIPTSSTSFGAWIDSWVGTVGGISINFSSTFRVYSSSTPVSASTPIELDSNLSSDGVDNVTLLMDLLKARLGSEGFRRKRNASGAYITDSMGNYVLEPCNVFSDSQLYIFLKAALAEFNSIPHATTFTFEDNQFVNEFQHELTEGAFILALAQKALLEKGKEFSVTDNGITFQPPLVADLLHSVYLDFMNRYTERLRAIKCQFKPSPVVIVSGYSLQTGTKNPLVARLRFVRARQIF